MTHNKKFNIVLDLDQTLISAEDFKNKSENDPKSQIIPYKKMDTSYIIYERPYLQPFLDYIFKNFNVSVWTAASKSYGLFIIKEIILTKPNRSLDYFLHSSQCDKSEKKLGGCKNLDMLFHIYKFPGYSKENTIIIDDLHDVYETQPDNCLHIHPFEFTEKNSEHDVKLIEVIKKLNRIKNMNK